ncbi:hypothetical protein [Gordonia aichiensis]
MLVVIAAVGLLLISCSTGKKAPLPDSSVVVDSQSPLTAEQARSVRQHGRALMDRIMAEVDAGSGGVDSDRSTEQWRSCTAKQKFAFEPTRNGVQYSATVFIDRLRGMTVETFHHQTRESGVEWNRDDATRGKAGVYDVQIAHLRAGSIQVYSPCYYLQAATDSNSFSADDIENVTSFLQQKWDQG